MSGIFRSLGELLVKASDAREEKHVAPEKPDPFQANVIGRLEDLTNALEGVVSVLRKPVVLCGVTLHPEWLHPVKDNPYGMVSGGGKATLLSHDTWKVFHFDVFAPMKSFGVKAWGGAVIGDVTKGNQVLTLNDGRSNGFLEGSFGPVEAGTRIMVAITIPFEAVER